MAIEIFHAFLLVDFFQFVDTSQLVDFFQFVDSCQFAELFQFVRQSDSHSRSTTDPR